MIGVVSGKSNDFQKRSNIWKRNATLEYNESGEFLPARSGCALLNCCTHQACFAATPRKVYDGANWPFVHVHTYTCGSGMPFVGVSAYALGESAVICAMITRYT